MGYPKGIVINVFQDITPKIQFFQQKMRDKFGIEPRLFTRVGPTGFLQSDDDAKLKIDEF